MTNSKNSFLKVFAEFYQEIHEDISTIKSSDNIDNNMIAKISSKYIKKINLKLEIGFNDINDHNYLNLREFMYIITAFIDESFIRLKWKGVKYWEDNLIEEKIFKTHFSGNHIFKRIDFILSDANYSKLELAKIYFEILSLGFTGKYGDEKNHIHLKNYKNQLFGFIYQNLPFLDLESKVLIESNYNYNITGKKISKNIYIKRPWILLVIFMIFIYFSSTLYIWNKNIRDLKSEINLFLEVINGDNNEI